MTAFAVRLADDRIADDWDTVDWRQEQGCLLWTVYVVGPGDQQRVVFGGNKTTETEARQLHDALAVRLAMVRAG